MPAKVIGVDLTSMSMMWPAFVMTFIILAGAVPSSSYICLMRSAVSGTYSGGMRSNIRAPTISTSLSAPYILTAAGFAYSIVSMANTMIASGDASINAL